MGIVTGRVAVDVFARSIRLVSGPYLSKCVNYVAKCIDFFEA